MKKRILMYVKPPYILFFFNTMYTPLCKNELFFDWRSIWSITTLTFRTLLNTDTRTVKVSGIYRMRGNYFLENC